GLDPDRFGPSPPQRPRAAENLRTHTSSTGRGSGLAIIRRRSDRDGGGHTTRGHPRPRPVGCFRRRTPCRGSPECAHVVDRPRRHRRARASQRRRGRPRPHRRANTDCAATACAMSHWTERPAGSRRWPMTHLCAGKLRILVCAKPDGSRKMTSTTTLLTLNISPTEIAVPAMNSAGITNEGFRIGAAQVSKEYDEALAKVGGSVRARRRGGVDV